MVTLERYVLHVKAVFDSVSIFGQCELYLLSFHWYSLKSVKILKDLNVSYVKEKEILMKTAVEELKQVGNII